eukprot:CAMPEP_0185599522 /NCGR_PEP_ID=MMETSP0434-20130131/82766_1 /TAXON_ID=626734 ORGANISM="Favella taraikaensis, Strain Fe Narragansett Bay" /NCGR_SAMPLE_ID=MMETSP0434 /ASSEMBLY_ACC=CAM_ASM_000379 /LENGTH=208 /DNA_ID=CAMNT_0028228967 /DNA_START=2320 /DNA_END=2945 /DNA_ORIENTATION=-
MSTSSRRRGASNSAPAPSSSSIGRPTRRPSGAQAADISSDTGRSRTQTCTRFNKFKWDKQASSNNNNSNYSSSNSNSKLIRRCSDRNWWQSKDREQMLGVGEATTQVAQAEAVVERERAAGNIPGAGQARPVSYPIEKQPSGEDVARATAAASGGAGQGAGGSGIYPRRRKKTGGRASDAESVGGGPPASNFPSGAVADGADQKRENI